MIKYIRKQKTEGENFVRVFLVVIDSFGVGELPDADKYGDKGSNTYKNIYLQTKVKLPFLTSLGLDNIDGVNIESKQNLIGSFGRMSEKTAAKDSVAGHYEIAGIVLEHPYPVFPDAFDRELMHKLEDACGVKFLGNEVASGTEIIARLGEEHLKTGMPIIYTSQDSVLQIAADEETFGLERLYKVCEIAREVCNGKYNVARVIARPFLKIDGKFIRTENRHDYAKLPPQKSMLDYLNEAGFDTISIGKVYDIFCGQGINQAIVAKNNKQGLDALENVSKQDFDGLCFANLVDTDMLYGHRNNVVGYAEALKEIDMRLDKMKDNLSKDDVLIVTADHGCDPTTSSTDHTREYVPLLVYCDNAKSCVNFGTLHGFDNISKSLLDLFGVQKYEDSFFKKMFKNFK